MRTDGGGYRRDHLRALAQCVEGDQKELRIMASKKRDSAHARRHRKRKTTGFGVRSLYRSDAPRPMKMGNTLLPWHYDVAAYRALQAVMLRSRSILPGACSANVYCLYRCSGDPGPLRRLTTRRRARGEGETQGANNAHDRTEFGIACFAQRLVEALAI